MTYRNLILECYPLLIQGTMATLQVFFAAAAISVTCGLFSGICLSKKHKVPFLSPFLEGVCFLYRAIPFYVQLLIVYFVLPDLCGFTLAPFSAAIFSLGMCSSGYVAQIVRVGIDSIPRTQWESAFNLGYSTCQTLRFVILPQMVRHILPAFVGEMDALIKSTAITASIGVLELTRVGMNIVSRELEPVAIYLTIAFLYLCISSLLNGCSKILERKLSYAKS